MCLVKILYICIIIMNNSMLFYKIVCLLYLKCLNGINLFFLILLKIKNKVVF